VIVLRSARAPDSVFKWVQADPKSSIATMAIRADARSIVGIMPPLLRDSKFE